MIPDLIKRILIFSISSLSGLLVSGGSVTVVISILNYLAQDGPLFPPPLVAAFVVAPPLAILVLLEAAALIYEWHSGERLGSELIGLGGMAGLGCGALLHQVLVNLNQGGSNLLQVMVFLGLGLLTGCTIFGVHWLGNRFWNYIDPHLMNTDRRTTQP